MSLFTLSRNHDNIMTNIFNELPVKEVGFETKQLKHDFMAGIFLFLVASSVRLFRIPQNKPLIQTVLGTPQVA